MITVPADKINLDFVLGNKVMVGTVNANREYFEMGVGDLSQAEAEYPGWLKQLLTHPVKGLENYGDLFEKLMHDEEEHIDFLETQLDLVAKLGLELYAQNHIGKIDDDHD